MYYQRAKPDESDALTADCISAEPLQDYWHGQVVVLDNLGAHKGEQVRDLVEACGTSLLFLPAYSPDFSPIEEVFSKIKALLKKEAARTKESLVEAISRALDAVAPEDAKGWFVHCGFEFVEAQC